MRTPEIIDMEQYDRATGVMILQGKLHFSSKAAASLCGLQPASIPVYCRRHEIGRKIGQTWFLDEDELAWLKTRVGQRGKPLEEE